MKTAISVPDETFARVDRQAKQLGMSRSEFFATAAERYLEDLERGALTAHINAALDVVEADESTEFAVEVGHHRVLDTDW